MEKVEHPAICTKCSHYKANAVSTLGMFGGHLVPEHWRELRGTCTATVFLDHNALNSTTGLCGFVKCQQRNPNGFCGHFEAQ